MHLSGYYTGPAMGMKDKIGSIQTHKKRAGAIGLLVLSIDGSADLK
ncbi:hypothetical protein [Desmospora profundinema]|uniref:Uncharacterized protein n=1 Tax=Desmospora profundinema TaxID=1571184 RepID=A0ABU1IHD4_9BACL|nr:hypothetical protein [Desmospora profundinema]MDR6224191.1 hypothetical protein [Desmospora profundinema]